MKITNFKKKKMEVLTNKQYDSYKNAKICNLCEEKFEDS